MVTPRRTSPPAPDRTVKRLVLRPEGITGEELSDPVDVRTVVEISGTVRVREGAAEALPAVRLLREASALGLPVRWTVDIAAEVRVWSLTHLYPPHMMHGPTDPDLADWRRRFRYALCYHRRGPGFLAVHDARREPPVRRTLTDPAAVEAIEELQRPRLVASLSPPIRHALPELGRLGLVLHLGGRALALTWRPRRWPIPCTL